MRNKENPKVELSLIISIPKHLNLEGRTELNDFPLNVLFAQWCRRGGIPTIASALYEPDLQTYEVHTEGKILTYHNVYGPNAQLTITRNNLGWRGQKEINTVRRVLSFGNTWKNFFTQFTATGLVDGEPVLFEGFPDLESGKSRYH